MINGPDTLELAEMVEKFCKLFANRLPCRRRKAAASKFQEAPIPIYDLQQLTTARKKFCEPTSYCAKISSSSALSSIEPPSDSLWIA
jgi:hypothetical protein